MKFLADENIPARAVRAVREEGYDLAWVAGVRRGGKAQEVFWVEWVFPRVEISSADVWYCML